ncbi:thioredoxin domain-containing protein [Ditylenchus destructor]|nr:thioredoxin domain-containing protein [Ditylenchus destructor]
MNPRVVNCLFFMSLMISASDANGNKKVSEDKVEETNVEKPNELLKISDNNVDKFLDILNNESKVVVLFHATWCGPSQMIMPAFRNLPQKDNKKDAFLDKFRDSFSGIKFIIIDIDKNPAIANMFGIRAMPTVLFFLHASDANGNKKVSEDKVEETNVEKPNELVEISDNNLDKFLDILNNERKVVVLFHVTWCGPSQMIMPAFRNLPQKDNKKDAFLDKFSDSFSGIKFIIINSDENPAIAHMYGIRALPTIVFFLHGDKPKEVVGAVHDYVPTLEAFLIAATKIAHEEYPSTNASPAKPLPAANTEANVPAPEHDTKTTTKTGQEKRHGKVRTLIDAATCSLTRRN